MIRNKAPMLLGEFWWSFSFWLGVLHCRFESFRKLTITHLYMVSQCLIGCESLLKSLMDLFSSFSFPSRGESLLYILLCNLQRIVFEKKSLFLWEFESSHYILKYNLRFWVAVYYWECQRQDRRLCFFEVQNDSFLIVIKSRKMDASFKLFVLFEL